MSKEKDKDGKAPKYKMNVDLQCGACAAIMHTHKDQPLPKFCAGSRTKPLTTLTPAELGVELTTRTNILKVAEPPKRKGGGKVKDVAELVDKLRNEAKVI